MFDKISQLQAPPFFQCNFMNDYPQYALRQKHHPESEGISSLIL